MKIISTFLARFFHQSFRMISKQSAVQWITGEAVYFVVILTPLEMELSVYTAAGLGPWFTTGVNVNSSVAISVAMHRDDLSLTRRHNCLDNISQNFTLAMQLFHYTSLAELWSTVLYMHLIHCTASNAMQQQWRQHREAERGLCTAQQRWARYDYAVSGYRATIYGTTA